MKLLREYVERRGYHWRTIRRAMIAGEVPLANLWLTLAQAAGVKRERFADSTGAINQVRA